MKTVALSLMMDLKSILVKRILKTLIENYDGSCFMMEFL